MALRGSGSANVFSTTTSNSWSLSRRCWLRQAITVAPVTSCANGSPIVPLHLLRESACL